MWYRILGVVVFSSLLSVASAQESVQFESSEQSLQIELFTSQGCSSCPPAERWLNKWEKHSGLWSEYFPMAFHVDYWDQLGWPDPFASGEFSWRQRTYKQQGLSKSVYTPGLMINGHEWRGWFHGKTLPKPQPRQGKLIATIDRDNASVNYRNTESQNKRLVLNSAILGVGLSTYVKRGENARKQLKQDFVVLDYNQTISNTGTWQLPVEKPAIEAPRYAIVYWVSEMGSQKPLQITGGWIDEKWLQSN